MGFLSLAKQRCSVRKYKTDEIEKEKLDKILEAARIAPTAANAQSQRLLVISSQEAKEKLSKGVNYHGAPLAIIVCGDHSDVFVRPLRQSDRERRSEAENTETGDQTFWFWMILKMTRTSGHRSSERNLKAGF